MIKTIKNTGKVMQFSISKFYSKYLSRSKYKTYICFRIYFDHPISWYLTTSDTSLLSLIIISYVTRMAASRSTQLTSNHYPCYFLMYFEEEGECMTLCFKGQTVINDSKENKMFEIEREHFSQGTKKVRDRERKFFSTDQKSSR